MQLKKLDFKILSELMKDARLSDREIAKRIGPLSQLSQEGEKNLRTKVCSNTLLFQLLGKLAIRL